MSPQAVNPQARYSVTLSQGDIVEVTLADGRVAVLDGNGFVQVCVTDPDNPLALGFARLALPSPEVSMSDHRGFWWDVLKSPRR